LQTNGITISDVSKQFNQNLKHSIDVPGKDFTIPLEMRGVISFFDFHKLSQDKLAGHVLPCYHDFQCTFKPLQHFICSTGSSCAVKDPRNAQALLVTCHGPLLTIFIPCACLSPAWPAGAVPFLGCFLTCLQPQSAYAKMPFLSKADQIKKDSHSKLVSKQKNISPTSIPSSAYL
jgi:hypothetical protein